ncbi:GNAT family N-acetyltransferase [Candidatus Dojkabacteria bacterium]|uniref:GNAT family N-acetyltransferase n=1 Tax=Candidatus Dojkabacteria bacterium TaxID=2099670 RepID=A0A955L9J2_9BACT|nr:GNAT family N-acetyltransferase [Candidatus Dojkabacteria bacterium]
MNIKILQKSNLNEYKRFRLQALKDCPLAFYSDYYENVDRPDEKWLSHLGKVFSEDSSTNIGMFEGDTLIGMATGIGESYKKRSHVAKIAAVYVDPNHRQKGVGGKILDFLITEIMKNSNVVMLELEVNAKLQAPVTLYKSRGFKECGIKSKAMKVDGLFYNTIVMEKEIRN